MNQQDEAGVMPGRPVNAMRLPDGGVWLWAESRDDGWRLDPDQWVALVAGVSETPGPGAEASAALLHAGRAQVEVRMDGEKIAEVLLKQAARLLVASRAPIVVPPNSTQRP